MGAGILLMYEMELLAFFVRYHMWAQLLLATRFTIHFLAIDSVRKGLSTELKEYLKRGGLSKKKIMQCSADTRMYHDLGFYGDIAEAWIDMLVVEYHVDLSGFEFEKFFPPEFEGEDMLTCTVLWLVPFAAAIVRRRKRDTYLPLTLGMIDNMIHTKKWCAAESG